jgi:predicted phage terminase large subunit-like protein
MRKEIYDFLRKEEIPTLLEYALVYAYDHKGEQYVSLEGHQLIEDRLMDVVFKATKKNLMICMPPGFGKSELAIKIFISWIYSFLPDSQFIVAANTLSLAASHVKAIRDILLSDWYQLYFERYGAKIDRRKNLTRSDTFETKQGGMTKGIGLGGLVSGFRAGQKLETFSGCFICDDLLREKDFNSQNQRDIVYHWYKSTVESRRNRDDTPIIIIMQRLHPDDIVGRLLKEQPDRWNIIKMQAFDEVSQKSVWEELKSTETLLSMKNSDVDIEKYMFFAKYQQEPQLDLHATIKSHWWQYYERVEDIYPNIYYRIITMDTAYKAETFNDESVIQLWGFDGEGKNAYLLDMHHGRWEFPDLLAKTEQFYNLHNTFIGGRKLSAIYIEAQASGLSLVQTLRDRKLPVEAWLPGPKDPKDKVSRVLECTKYIGNSRVFLHKNAKYLNDFILQCAQFSETGATHDDMVDAMTMALLLWRKKYGAL